jgi:prepilin-type N-terminal cleavage/methylation domain-containing protein
VYVKWNSSVIKTCSSSGFSLLELLVTIVAIGVLSAIAVPSFLAFVDLYRLNAAQDEIYRALRQAQSQAKKEKLTWQFSLREYNGILQWATHQAEASKFIPDAVIWQDLDRSIRLDRERNNKNKYETTLQKHSSQQVWRVIFNYQGCPVYNVGDECTHTSLQALGQITLYSKNGGKTRRCVYVSTILGAMRTGKDRTRANESDKYCY